MPAHHPFVNLTWTVMAADLDFRKLKRGQLCNHFRPTGHLTTKVGLLECLRDYVAPQGTGAESQSDEPSEAAVEAARFFPRCYDLSNERQASPNPNPNPNPDPNRNANPSPNPSPSPSPSPNPSPSSCASSSATST